MYQKYINNTALFWFIILFIFIVFIISKKEITLSIFFGTFVAMIILFFVYNNHVYNEKENEQEFINKQNTIYPKFSQSSKYHDMTELLYSVQDMYSYNPEAYGEFIQNINDFYAIYENILDTNDNIGQKYDLLIDKKKNIINSFQSIVFKLPNNAQYTKYFNNKITEINTQFDAYLDYVVYLQKKSLYENGINCDTKLIDKSDIVSYDSFDNRGLFSYDIM
ncbi:hypothetical protein BMW23_0576 [Bodo saltans virus]|uniref:Uncharacterized protein n=1 Tax=Bodo saltans virus TaxID=2024608 RepID=A0A2H4UUL1_9VIRU|nr:hypothetical protein QJ851_gp0560 [Bodo saltans virus]ATZ80623.1 hypothetical protein BMW23_0576 [Bodo saltans virus]